MDFGMFSKMCASSPGASLDAHPAHFTVAVKRIFCCVIFPLSMLRLGGGTYTTIVHPFLTLGLVCSRAIHRTSVDRQRAIMHFAFGVFWLGYFCVLQTLKSNAKKVFLRVRRRIALLRTRFIFNLKMDKVNYCRSSKTDFTYATLRPS